MLKIVKIPLQCLVGCFILLNTCLADNSKETASTKGRQAYFACTALPKGLENPVLVRSGKKIVELELNKRLVSNPITVSQNGIVEIVRKSEVEGEYIVLARAQTVVNARVSLVIITPLNKPDQSHPTRLFHTQSVNLADFQGGDNLYINLSPHEVICKIGKKSLQIKPHSNAIYQAENIKKSTNMPVQYGYLEPDTKQWKLLSASTIVIRPTRREICIFSWNQNFKRVGYHGITFPVETIESQ